MMQTRRDEALATEQRGDAQAPSANAISLDEWRRERSDRTAGILGRLAAECRADAARVRAELDAGRGRTPSA